MAVGNFDVSYTLWLKDKLTPALKSVNNSVKGLGTYAEAGFNQLNTVFSKGNIAMMAMGAGVALVGKAIKEAMDFEQTMVQMEVMLGSADKATALMKDIEQFAAVTPFESKDLIESTRLLLQFGVAQNKVMPLMKQLGDITAGDSEKLHSMSLAFGQMSSTGRLMGQDLNQMINAGFNPLQEISKRTGKSMAELKKEMEKGQITIGMVEQAFADATGPGGRFNGMMEKQSKTMGGQWSTAMDAFNVKMREAGTIILPKLTGMLGSVNNAISGKNVGQSYLTWMKNGAQLLTPIGWGWLAIEKAVKKTDDTLKNVQPTYTSLHDQMQMIAKATIPQLKQGLDSQNQLLISAASITENQLTAALDRAQKMYGLTSQQIDTFMGKVREQKALMNEKVKPKTIVESTTEDLNNQVKGLKDLQEKLTGSTDDMKEFEKIQKDINQREKEIGRRGLTKKTSSSISGGGGNGTTIASRAPQNFYITIGTLVETINTKKETFNESDNETIKKVTTALTGALNDSQLIATNTN